ncbi:type III-B CRISPR module RAMP protein Cmr4 [Clostridium sp. HV4-5-A1G]|uniref:type III-B CRISPR module RAMP protein Cmr4 n=1 Tax=Clostridium sp. HV4-5-A1G TaxID=2004595 RepID=UPI00123B5CEF|nr:type III-B CRISPR module RAMP protein Cmr4 [Clostridium sp. HV4-5-A1G]KAA8675362.1 type III-B CRISPR module RAMP protein Cmr4 [Clostridium sp. HV4-5-A1G]
MNKSKMLFLKTIAPMHVGASEGLGMVDMPVQRESSTNIPKVESSTFKGELREACRKLFNEKDIPLLFGKEGKSGKLAFTDFKLLFFPVKSSVNIYSLISCPYILERFFEESILYNTDYDINKEKLGELIDECKYVKDDMVLIPFDIDKNIPKYIYLNDYLFKTRKIKFEDIFCGMQGFNTVLNRIVVVSNKNFIDFVTYYTEIVMRNEINNDVKTSKNKSLFTQEYIPSETIFYGIISKFNDIFDKENKDQVFNKFMQKLSNGQLKILQIGGNATLGKGLAEIISLGMNFDG